MPFLSLKPTNSRGKVSIGILIGLGVSSVLFDDLFLSILFAVLLILIASEAFWMGIVISKPDRFFVLTNRPETSIEGNARERKKERGGNAEREIEKATHHAQSVPLGETVCEDFLFVTKKARASQVSISTDMPYLKLNPRLFERNVVPQMVAIHAEFRTPYAGAYHLKYVKVHFLGLLGLFEADVKISVSLNYRVYPKVYDIATVSSKILEKSGIGEIPTEFPGIGSEFYDTREYQSGDDSRQINWKASARLGELIVNNRAKEVGASYYLVLDSTSTSYFDRDRLASTFLQISNILTVLGVNFGFIVHDGKQRIAFKEIDKPYASLDLARSAALNLAEIGEWKEQIAEQLLVSPLPSYVIKSIRDVLSRQGLGLLSEIEGIAQNQMATSLRNNDVLVTIIDITKKNLPEPPAILYIAELSSSSSSLAPIIEASAELRRICDAEFVVVDPTAPWVVAQNEEQAVRLYELHLKNLKVLSNSKVQYYTGEPMKIAEQLFA